MSPDDPRRKELEEFSALSDDDLQRRILEKMPHFGPDDPRRKAIEAFFRKRES
jgi:hypothetical protein